MDTVQHTSKNMNTAYRGFTMPTGRDGTRRGMAVREQSHDRKKEMAFFKKQSHDRKKTKSTWKTTTCDGELILRTIVIWFWL